MPIPLIPVIMPIGTAMRHRIIASYRTICFICFLVVPIDDKRPNSRILSLSEMEKELRIKVIEPMMTMLIRIPPILYRICLNVSLVEKP